MMIMAMLPKLSEMSYTELEEIAKAIKAEQDKRDDERFNALCKEVTNALNALKNEYPWISYDITTYCEACGESADLNLFELVDHFEVDHFYR